MDHYDGVKVLLLAIITVLLAGIFIITLIGLKQIMLDADETEKLLIEYIEETEGLVWGGESLQPTQQGCE